MLNGLSVVKAFGVEPHRGVGPVDLGMARAEVHRVMGPPTTTFRKGLPGTLVDAWHENAFQVFYDENDEAEFIELSRGAVDALLFERSVFETEPDTMLAFVAEHDEPDMNDPELGNTYVFLDLDLALWRADRKGDFDTIGVGKPGYYQHQD